MVVQLHTMCNSVFGLNYTCSVWWELDKPYVRLFSMRMAGCIPNIREHGDSVVLSPH
jgi:hypothetical protein